MNAVREYCRDHILLFDGAMGTYFAARTRRSAQACEAANLDAPEEITAIHRAYLAAGARALRTNTFAANRLRCGAARCRELLDAGWRIAAEAAGEEAFVFASVGPVFAAGRESAAEEYRFVADCLLDAGAENFIFETNDTDAGLHEAAAHIRARRPEAVILLSFAVQPDGFTRAGESAAALLARAEADENVDAAGFNCVSGARAFARLAARPEIAGRAALFLPNGGWPVVRGQRSVYESDPGDFACQTAELAARGARFLGGCCGTTPEHIAALARELERPRTAAAPTPPRAVPRPEPEKSAFWEALADPDARPFAVEFDPPESTDLTKYMAGARELYAAGADILTIADAPFARARLDAALLAVKLRRELGREALPHMTCRDRNLNATKGLLLGLAAEGVENVLAVTGDPIPSAERDEVKSVYQFNSRRLAGYISALKQTLLPESFRIYGGLNVNARNFSVQLALAKEKIENGVSALFTQPVLTEQALENLRLAHETLDAKLLCGIFPVVSHKNALFLDNELAGIRVDPRIIAAYEGLDRAAGEDLAVELSVRVAAAAAELCDGFYLMTPFSRTALMARIMAAIRRELG